MSTRSGAIKSAGILDDHEEWGKDIRECAVSGKIDDLDTILALNTLVRREHP